ncbi:MAG: hypothetical protein KDB68_16945, partial [Planctomycetes bacterium]|nr:hypothetical protein [Planctomycetota bacterium]
NSSASISTTGAGTITSAGLLTASNGLTVSAGTVSLPAGEIDNTELANSSLTVTAGTNLTGGGAVALGGSVTLNLDPTYAGQASITTLGTITTGVWNGTSIADGNVDNDLTISGGTINSTPVGATTRSTGAFTTLDANNGLTVTGNLTSFTAPSVTPGATYTAHDFIASVNGNAGNTSRAMRAIMNGSGSGSAEVTGAWLESLSDGGITQGVFGQAYYTGTSVALTDQAIGLDGRARVQNAGSAAILAIGTAGRADDTQLGSNVGVHAWASNGGFQNAGLFATVNSSIAQQQALAGGLGAGFSAGALIQQVNSGASEYGLYVSAQNNHIQGTLNVSSTVTATTFNGALSGNATTATTAANASQLLGNTWASPQAIGSGTAAAGTFTALTSTGATNLSTTGAVVTNIGSASAGNIGVTTGGVLTVLGTTNINTSGTGSTGLGNGTGNVTVNSANWGVDTFGAATTVSLDTNELKGAGTNQYAEKFTFNSTTGSETNFVINNSLVTPTSVVVVTMQSTTGPATFVFTAVPGVGTITVTPDSPFTVAGQNMIVNYVIVNP